MTPSERSAGVVLFRGAPREYLLLHYPSGHWDFPKGHVEAGETDVQAALREVAEETGIEDATILDGFDHEFQYTYRREGQAIQKAVRYFVGSTIAKDVRVSHEHRGFIWLPYEKAHERITYANAKNLLAKAEAFLAGRDPRPRQVKKR